MVGWRHGAVATIDFGEPVSSVATGGALEVEEVTVMLGGRHLETPAARLVAVDSLARYDGSAGCCAAICSGGVVCSGDFASRATHASASAAQCEVHCSERLECTAYEARGDGGCDIWTDPAISVSYCRLPRTLCPAAGLTPIPRRLCTGRHWRGLRRLQWHFVPCQGCQRQQHVAAYPLGAGEAGPSGRRAARPLNSRVCAVGRSQRATRLAVVRNGQCARLLRPDHRERSLSRHG